MSNALLQLELGRQKKKWRLELGEERRGEEGSKLARNKDSGSFQENTKRFALGVPCAKNCNFPKQETSHTSQIQYDLSSRAGSAFLSAGLVKVQSRGAHGRPDCKYIFSL